ncbi:hypothetical protein QFW96_16380 [Saccharopolyspora sp. TS4A08]|uniref:Uncharacterized protein n=1 Tax=Saccharopolyspora ipomoeae TaxID=3042027 RepID=A0ABT6PQC9_9PSEU|nr:hypothetical protein [Saccharopolyspora sp. TS4A08]MDI2030207.1 hypothetical protein [Saccharopolyspora sp. TS4A08]
MKEAQQAKRTTHLYGFPALVFVPAGLVFIVEPPRWDALLARKNPAQMPGSAIEDEAFERAAFGNDVARQPQGPSAGRCRELLTNSTGIRQVSALRARFTRLSHSL